RPHQDRRARALRVTRGARADARRETRFRSSRHHESRQGSARNMNESRMVGRSLVLTGVLLTAGCGGHCGGRKPASASTAAARAPHTATAANAALGEGPRITLSADNVHIEYRVYGHGDPAVLLVHGWACDENYWHAQLDALKAHYTVVTLNLAGHGASGGNRSDWSMANYAQDVAAVAPQLPNPQLVLVGHSMGAAVTLPAPPPPPGPVLPLL